jgi:hypothetical protein
MPIESVPALNAIIVPDLSGDRSTHLVLAEIGTQMELKSIDHPLPAA